MDVNSIAQGTINVNGYNSDLSGYGDTNTQNAVPQVHELQSETLKENTSKSEEYNKNELDAALKKVNNFLKDEHTYAEYSYYKDLKTTMIKIIDEDTNEVILEIPPKKILDMVASMCRQVGLIDKKA